MEKQLYALRINERDEEEKVEKMEKQVLRAVDGLPSEDKKITMRHALNKINQNELGLIISRYSIPLPSDIRKITAIKDHIASIYNEGRLNSDFFDEVRTLAFNPELYANDGFFLAFDVEIKTSRVALETAIEKWHKEIIIDDDNNKIDADIKIVAYEENKCKVLVTRKFDRYVHNGETMYSHQYFEIHSLVVEFNFDKRIIFIQTSNTVKFSSIKTVVSSFINFLVYGGNASKDEFVRMSIPKMKQGLSVSINEDGWSAKIHDNINPNTLKLLDLFLELENNSDNFNAFVCINITFDHEDSASNLDDRIKNQSYGADIGDLLKKSEIKDLILNKRTILQVEFKLEYTTINSEGNPKIHVIMAGIENGKHLRIYIYNNDLTIKETIKEAYKDLKLMFIEHLSKNELKNEAKIKKMLGL